MPQYIAAFNESVQEVGLRDLAVHYLGLRKSVYERVTSNTGSTHKVGLFGFRLTCHGENDEVIAKRIIEAQVCLENRLAPMLADKTETIHVQKHSLMRPADPYGDSDLWFSVSLSVSPR